MSDEQELPPRDELVAFIRKLAAVDLPETDDEVAARVGANLAAAARRKQENGSMTLRTGVKPLQFDWSLNLGHVLTIITILGGFVVAYGNYTSRVSSIEQSIEAANVRAARYIPTIEASTKANDVQDERIQNLSTALQEIRRSNAEMMTVLGNMREDMAQVKAKLSVERRQEGR